MNQQLLKLFKWMYLNLPLSKSYIAITHFGVEYTVSGIVMYTNYKSNMKPD